MTWQSLETKKEALNIECLIKNVRFIVGLLMLESITAVLKPATESLQGKQVDLGSCMTTITSTKQQLQEMNGDYWHNFLFPKIMKLGEELNVDIAFLTSGTFCCYLLLCPSPLVSLREFSPKYKGPRQPSEARWEQSDLRPLLSSQPIAPPCLHIKILLIRSA